MLYPSSRKVLSTAILLLLFTPTLAIAEVSDKELSLTSIWGISIALAVLSFLATYFYKWIGTLFSALALVWFIAHFLHIHFSDIGPALYAEQGASYFVQSYLSFALFLFGTILGAILHGRREKAE